MRRPGRARSRLLGGVVLVVALGVGACSDPEPDPTQVRQDRVEKRLRASFSASQARCIVDRVDPAVVRALDRTADLDADTDIMRAYSAAVAACVTDPTTTTTPTTTAVPEETSTPTVPGG